jgi:RNA polymerase sigma factor (sigma-70 family)
MGASLLRLRSDEQLVALFRAGHDEAFRVIHDRYRQRLFAYARQMLPGRQDAEDALQDVFVRAFANLRASDRELALRAWLYRVAHNRCVDELRRPAPPPPEAMQFICSPTQDPIAQADQRESLRRLVADIRRLPDQQRSALLMRELEGMSYADLAAALGVSVPAVKSLLVRARMALALAMDARDTACPEIREELVLAHDRRVRPNATARRHMRDCAGCRQFRGELRGVSRRLAALTPAVGPLGLVAKVLGLGGGAGGGAAAGGGTAALGGSAGTGALASAGALTTSAGHVVTLIAATVVTAGGAVEIQGTITPPVQPRVAHHAVRAPAGHGAPGAAATPAASGAIGSPQVATAEAVIVAAVVQPARSAAPANGGATAALNSATPAARKHVAGLTGSSTAGGRLTTESSKARRSQSSDDGTVLPALAASATQPSGPGASSPTVSTGAPEGSNTATLAGSSGSSTETGNPSVAPSQNATGSGAASATTGAASGSSSSDSGSSSSASATS